MDQLAQYAQQIADLLRQHAPNGTLPPVAPTAIVALIFGVGICVLGAKLARWLITVAFAVGGLAAGLRLGGYFGVAPMYSSLVGAAMLGAVGFMMHRLWVGLFTGAFLASVAFGVLSTQVALPHLSEFEAQQRAAIAQTEVTQFEPGPVGDAVQAGWDRLIDYGKDFFQFVSSKHPAVEKWGPVSIIVAAGFGLLMGIFLCRSTLILFTAAFGTSLIGSGMTMLGGQFEIDMLKLFQERPGMSALALGAFFVFSVVLQTMLTRPDGGSSAPAKSD
jgi:hypothetical protein